MCASANKCITCADSWPYEGPRPALASQPRGGGSPAKDLDPRDLPLRCAFSARLPARILRAASQTRARQSLPHYNTATDRPPAATARVAVAMFSPAHAAVLSCFCPLGNTPAASLTAQLPPDLPARALCRGCGGARNVLFTAC